MISHATEIFNYIQVKGVNEGPDLLIQGDHQIGIPITAKQVIYRNLLIAVIWREHIGSVTYDFMVLLNFGNQIYF